MHDLYGPINKYIIYPLYYWKNNDKRLKRLDQLEKNQYLSDEELHFLQLKKTKNIINYAYNNTAYYRRIMRKIGISPNDIVNLEDIKHIPILTKDIIQNNLEELISSQFKKHDLVQDASGGSTGTPTIYYKDLDRHNLRRADQIRHDRWTGWDIGKKSALIWGAQRDLKAIQSYQEFIISHFIERRWELDAFELSPDKMFQFKMQLEKIKPSMILGYANALVKYSKFLIDEYPDHNIRPDGIISSAETLTEEKRSLIESAFQTKVLNRYGSREVGLIASECKFQQGLHINADNVLVEIVNDDKPVEIGKSGDILVTDFSNFGMPFIRYKMQDRGYLKPGLCSCGRGLPLLGAIEGRTGDFFVSQNGTLVHGEYFTHLFYGIPEVLKFQLVQESLENIELKIVENKNTVITRKYIDKIENKIHEMLGNQAVLTTHFVKDIPSTASGKFLFTISKVNK